MAALPTGTVTFLFTDIEGSTMLLHRLGDRRYAAVLEEHHRLLRAAFAEGNGKEVDRQGDAFLVAFSRARDAIGTAVAAQLALTRRPGRTTLRCGCGWGCTPGSLSAKPRATWVWTCIVRPASAPPGTGARSSSRTRLPSWQPVISLQG